MLNIIKSLVKKKDKLVSKYITKTERTIVLKKKPVSIWEIKKALIDEKIITDDGYLAKDIVDINSAAIWNNFRTIYEKNEKKNVLNGHFSFYIEENSFLSQVFDVNPEQFKEVLAEFTQNLGCSVSFSKETIDAFPGVILNKVTVKHYFFSKDRNVFSHGINEQ